MKKILFLATIFLVSLSAFSQIVRPTPTGFSNQPDGSPTTFKYTKGIMYPGVGYAPAIWTDTATANASPLGIKNIALIQISTSDGKNWYRDVLLNKWNEMGSGSADGNNYPTTLSFSTVNGILTLGRNGLSSLNMSLDGRYALLSDTSSIADRGWRLKGNTGTDAAINFIGTTDFTPMMFRFNNLRAGMIASTNTGFGYYSLYNIDLVVDGNNLNTAFGQSAGRAIAHGTDNVAIGYEAMGDGFTTPNSQTYNTAVGVFALAKNQSNFNSAFGRRALSANTTGNQNSAFGANAGLRISTGFKVQAFGAGAFENCQTCQESNAYGNDAGLNDVSGLYNNYFGVNAKGGATAIGNNIMGYYAGASYVGATRYNVVIGHMAAFHASQKVTPVNTVVIGNNAFTDSDSSVVIGNSGMKRFSFWGALRPNNLSGAAGYVLMSMGANTSPVWVNSLTLDSLNVYRIRMQSDGARLLITDVAGTDVSLDASPTDGGGVGIGTLNDVSYRLKVMGSFMFGNNAYSDGGLISNYGDGTLFLGDGAVNVNGTLISINDGAMDIVINSASLSVAASAVEFYGLPLNNTATQVVGADGGFLSYRDISTIGIQSLGAIGSSPNANGATIASNVLNLQPASASFGGVVTTGAQTLGVGAKTVTSLISLLPVTINGVTFGSQFAGSGSVIIGNSAAPNNRSNTTAVGASALGVNNAGVGGNTAIGNTALLATSSGYNNTATGFGAGYGITTGHDNTAIGIGAMGTGFITVGTVGITGSFNTAVGYNSLYYEKGSSQNTAIGYQALGGSSLASVNGLNIAVGSNSLSALTTGSYNVGIGSYDGSGIATKSKWVVISDGFGNPKMYMDSVGNVGIGIAVPLALLHVNGISRFENYGDLLEISAPATPSSGYGRFYMRADSFRVKNDGGTEFTLGAGGGGGITGVTTFGSTPNANGLSVSGSNILMQPTDGTTNPGGLSIGTQSIGGVKTFLNNVIFNGDISTPDFTFISLGGVTRAGSNGPWQFYRPGVSDQDFYILNANATNGFNIFSSTMEISNYVPGNSIRIQTGTGGLSIGASAPSASAKLDVNSTTKGFLPPRMTNAQVAAISSPATGLIAYSTDALMSLQYNGTAYKSVGIVSGSFSGAGTATTVFTVTFGGTQPNATYKVNVTPTAALSAALFYVTNKTTTTFDVTYLAGLTGTVTFDWVISQ